MPRDPALDDEAVLRHIRVICSRLDGVDEARLQDRPLFRVRRRRFAIFNAATSPPRPRWAASGRSLHFVTPPDDYDALRHDGRFTRSPHHGDRRWLALALDDPDATDWQEVAELLDAAHRLVMPRRHADPTPL